MTSSLREDVYSAKPQKPRLSNFPDDMTHLALNSSRTLNSCSATKRSAERPLREFDVRSVISPQNGGKAWKERVVCDELKQQWLGGRFDAGEGKRAMNKVESSIRAKIIDRLYKSKMENGWSARDRACNDPVFALKKQYVNEDVTARTETNNGMCSNNKEKDIAQSFGKIRFEGVKVKLESPSHNRSFKATIEHNVDICDVGLNLLNRKNKEKDVDALVSASRHNKKWLTTNTESNSTRDGNLIVKLKSIAPIDGGPSNVNRNTNNIADIDNNRQYVKLINNNGKPMKISSLSRYKDKGAQDVLIDQQEVGDSSFTNNSKLNDSRFSKLRPRDSDASAGSQALKERIRKFIPSSIIQNGVVRDKVGQQKWCGTKKISANRSYLGVQEMSIAVSKTHRSKISTECNDKLKP